MKNQEKERNLAGKELLLLKRISILLCKERNFDVLFAHILDAAVEFTSAEGATIYMVHDEEKNLKFMRVFNSVMKVSLKTENINWPPVPLYKDDQKNLNNLAALCYHKKKSFNFADVYQQNVFDNSGTISYDIRNNYRTKSIVAIPMMDHKDNIIGVIQLINARNAAGEIINFAPENVKKLEALTSITAILMNNHKLVDDLRTTFYQFIKSIAWAIDRKSKHFSGHIARVSELVNDFAEEINRYKGENSPFAECRFSEDELEEINIAGLMHDLGKIITPMHILDKSAKLEKIIDRIVVINERISHIKTILDLKKYTEASLTDDEITRNKEKLDHYKKVLQEINTGRNFLTPEELQLLKEIKEYRCKFQDKEYFIINDDEYYNLTIKIGTLNMEDIKIIREHAYVTGKMLSQIKFPTYLARAPLYAEQHHEKLNGKGYPKGLKDSEIPLQSRILALADVFEALTAKRPYKETKKLSETYKILHRMVETYELDGTLLDFALEQNIFLRYARKHLKEEQIDME